MAWKGDDDQTVGQRVAQRGDLNQRTIAGKTVYSGGLGDEMLGGVGAIASVMDTGDGGQATIVNSGFDANNPQHQRTLIHELSHQDLNMDEAGAKAFERVAMVMQAMDNNFSIEKGLDMMGKMKGIANDQIEGEAISKLIQGDERRPDDEGNPMDGYFGMMAQGMPHEEITKELAKWGSRDHGEERAASPVPLRRRPGLNAQRISR